LKELHEVVRLDEQVFDTYPFRPYMKKIVLLAFAAVLVASCAPVIRSDLMDRGIRDFSFNDLLAKPEMYRGQLFILGGIIVSTTVAEEGSLIEALYLPVDSSGYLKDNKGRTFRFLALYPKEKGILDPVIYRRGRQVTVAGIFKGLRPGKIDQMEYAFPEFAIDDCYLWEELPQVQYVPRYYAPYPGWDPFWGPPWPYRYYRQYR
jgi:outer membrane lipoprotein